MRALILLNSAGDGSGGELCFRSLRILMSCLVVRGVFMAFDFDLLLGCRQPGVGCGPGGEE